MRTNCKLMVIMGLIVLVSVNLNSQSQTNTNYTSELQKLTKIPNSPEAQAFQKYGNTSVSLYTGTPNVQIPFHTIEGREMSVPMSLTYDASGVKVESFATNVGLNWNMKVGGRISRIVNGAPDDCFYATPAYTGIFTQAVRDKINLYTSGSTTTFSSSLATTDYLTFMKDVSTGKIDSQPDYFALDVDGISDVIVFGTNPFVPRALKNPRIKVEYTTLTSGVFTYVNTWTVTGEDGKKYYFNLAEYTKGGDDFIPDSGSTPEFYGLFKHYNASWVLTKIESPNKKDTFDFIYTDMGEWTQDVTASVIAKNYFNSNDGNAQANSYGPTYGSVDYITPSYRQKQYALNQINHNGIKILDIVLAARTDYPINNAVSEIRIYNLNDAASVIKRIKMSYDYFGNAASSSMGDKRLKLNTVEFKTSSNLVSQKYLLEYNSPTSVPPRSSLKQDYLGFYNGKNNTVLYPAVTGGIDTYQGANRDADITYARYGSLSKITYPTGGFSLFEYDNASVSTTTTTSQDQTFGTASVTGGVGNSADCGNCCIDAYGNPPKIASVNMTITTPGTYKVDFIKTGSGGMEGFLFKKSSTAIVPYSSIVNQSNCVNSVQLAWSGAVAVTNANVELVAGTYQLTVVKDIAGSSATLKVHKVVSVPVTTTEQKAGLRIKSITDYEDVSKFASKKEYRYTTTPTGTVSSAQVIWNPVLVYNSTYYTVSNNSPTAITNINRLSYNSNSSEAPHVAYSKVYEFTKNASGQNEGYVEHKFFTGHSGITTITGTPFPNYFSINEDAGRVNENNTYNNTDVMMTQDKFDYAKYTTTASTKSMYAVLKPEYTNSYVQIYPLGNGSYGYQYVNPVNSSSPTPPPSCTQPGNSCLSPMGKYAFQLNLNGAGGAVAEMIKSESSQFYNNTSVTKTVEYNYNAPTIDYLLRDTKTYTSDSNIKLTEKYSYPKDYGATAPLNAMVSANRLSDIIKTETSQVVGTVVEPIGIREMEIVQYGSAYLPKYLKESKGSATPVKRLRYVYDGSNNLSSHALYNGEDTPTDNNTYTSYIWGYRNTLPIAKLENIKYSNIASATITDLQIKSNADKDATTEATLLAALNGLRTAYPQALITTYTYDPGVGVKTITDPKGYLSSFEYNVHNRLIYVKDKDGNVLKEYKYNYRLNP